ncbi:hypothetical protein HK100_009273, partial [Physocladia obscura]
MPIEFRLTANTYVVCSLELLDPFQQWLAVHGTLRNQEDGLEWNRFAEENQTASILNYEPSRYTYYCGHCGSGYDNKESAALHVRDSHKQTRCH